MDGHIQCCTLHLLWLSGIQDLMYDMFLYLKFRGDPHHTHTHTHTHTLQCHVSSIPIYVSLKRRKLNVFSVVIIAAIIICLLVYTLTGVFGYLTFHGHYCLASDILRNYCPRDITVDIARGLLIVVMVTSYPILTFCGR